MCTEGFGLSRSQALKDPPLMTAYRGSDRVLLARLALRGRIIQLSEPLFGNRDHAARFIQAPCTTAPPA